jgi:hypothetical protein
MMYRIHYEGGKVRECDVPDFETAIKHANAYGGLVRKIVKVDIPPGYLYDPETGKAYKPAECFSQSEMDEQPNRAIVVGAAPNTRKRGKRG